MEQGSEPAIGWDAGAGRQEAAWGAGAGRQRVGVDWRLASCRGGTLVPLFFSDQLDEIAAARELCRSCPLIEGCLRGALERREPWGVWGGELFCNGAVLAQKRRRGRPRKDEQVAQPA